MIKKALLATVTLFAAQLAHAGDDFGTREEAQKLAAALIAIVDADGLEAAIAAMHDRNYPFIASPMGVNLFEGSIVVADNREPEMIAAEYAETADLTGALVWPLISAAAYAEDDAVLKWYHYDTQQAYDYHCFSMRTDRDNAYVMVCR